MKSKKLLITLIIVAAITIAITIPIILSRIANQNSSQFIIGKTYTL